MLHVLLLILKIIGLLLLGILALVLGLVLLVLLVPIRYQVKGSFYGKPEGFVKVTWLLHILSVAATYQEDLQVSVKLFGFRLFRDAGEPDEEAFEEEMVHAMELPGQMAEDFIEDPILREMDSEAVEKPVESRGESHRADEAENPGEGHGNGKRTAPPGKGPLEAIMERWNSLRAGWQKLAAKKEEILEFIKKQENQDTARLIVRQVKAVVRHILPRKVRGSITFGFDDPYMTGQVLSAASILYAWYGGHLQITPVFEDEVLEGEGFLKGRIRMGTVLILGIRILLNKNFRILLKRWRGKGGLSDGR